MKQLLIGLFALGSVSAHAHPTDNLPMSMVGNTAIFTVLRDVNVPPGNRFINMYYTLNQYYSRINKVTPTSEIMWDRPHCALELSTSSVNDRVIKAGTTFTTFFKSEYFVDDTKNYKIVKLGTSLRTPIDLYCYEQEQHLKIGNLKNDTYGTLDITYPDPDVIH